MSAVLAPSPFGLLPSMPLSSFGTSGYHVVVGVPDDVARRALDLLNEAPTLSVDELTDFLGITAAQAKLCIAFAQVVAW